MLRRQQPIGVILGGGRGLRMGGGKLAVALDHRPLISYPLQAMQSVLTDVAVIAKADSQLPNLTGVMLWVEPDEPHHPLLGIAEALALSGGRPVISCPGDMPFVSPGLLSRVLVEAGSGPATVVSCDGAVQPLIGCYRPEAATWLLSGARAGASATRTVMDLEPKLVELPASAAQDLFNVNSPDELLRAAAILDSRRISRT